MKKTVLMIAMASGVLALASRSSGADVKIWTSDVVSLETSTNAVKALTPITLVGARNGFYSGKLVVESSAAIQGLKVSMGALTGPGGAIPAADVQIRYAKDGDWTFWTLNACRPLAPDALLETTPDVPVKSWSKRAVLPVWITVHVPKEAIAGLYNGEVTVQLEGGAPVKMKLSLDVANWTLPDPQDYRVWTDFVQSPDTLAVEYNVPLWSERHWELIARSFRLLSPTGSRTLYVPLIVGGNFGNEQSMVRWIEKGENRFEYDYSILDRYLDTAEKNLGKPKLVIFQIWDICLSRDPKALGSIQNNSVEIKNSRANLLGKGPRVTVLDPATKATTNLFLPRYEEAASQALWQPMIAEVKKRMAKRGLEKTMLLGLINDAWPSKDEATFWKDVSGDAPWAIHSHFGPARDYIPGHKALHKIVDIGYGANVYGELYVVNPDKGRRYGWREPSCFAEHLRWQLNTVSPAYLREALTFQITGAQRGLGRMGGDYWPAVKDRKGKAVGTVGGRYPENSWRQLDILDWFLAPGPEGAVATSRLEIMKESAQVCETRVFLEDTLLDGRKKAKIGDELAKRCQEALDAHHRAMWKTQWSNDEDLNGLGTLGDSGGFILNGVPQSGMLNALLKDGEKAFEDKHGGMKKAEVCADQMRKGEAQFVIGWQAREKRLFDLAGEVATKLAAN